MGLHLGVHQDIGRLQIAVEDAPLVGVMDGACRHRHQPGRAARVGSVAFEPLVQTLPGDQLHAEIVLIFIPADLEDRHDVGVVEPGDRLGLVLKPAVIIVAGKLGRLDHLQGDRAVEADLTGLVNDPHAALAQHALQLVVAEVAYRRALGQRGRLTIAAVETRPIDGRQPRIRAHARVPRARVPLSRQRLDVVLFGARLVSRKARSDREQEQAARTQAPGCVRRPLGAATGAMVRVSHQRSTQL